MDRNRGGLIQAALRTAAFGLGVLLAMPAPASEYLLPDLRYRAEADDSWLTRASGRTASGLYGWVNGAVSDVWYLASSPVHWRTKEWLTLGAVAGGTTAVLFWGDEEVRRVVRRNPDFGDFGDSIRPVARWYTLVGVSGAFLVGGVVLDREKERQTAGILFESALYGTSLSFGLKEAIGRERPRGRRAEKDNFDPFGGDRSMPSGEVMNAFLMAGAITSQYPHWAVQTGVYSLATAASLGRVARSAHWASDVVATAATALYVSKTVARLHQERAEAGADAELAEELKESPLFVYRPEPTYRLMPRGLGLRWEARW